MSPSLAALLALATCGCSIAITWAVREHACRRHLLDHPNERSSHSVARPRLGGVGIFAAFLPAAIALGVLAGAPATFFLVLAGTAVISALGIVDDLRPVPARWRFAVQLATAAVVVTASGAAEGSPWLAHLPRPLPEVLLVLWIVWVTNLYNFMDGIDGLAGGQAVVASIAIALAAFSIGATTTGWLALLLAAATLGFLLFNFPPASIFMGDVGSTALGFLFATMPLLPEARPIPVEVVGLALSLFVLDATVTLIRRIARGERWFEAHRTHHYQRLVALGLRHRSVTLWGCAGMIVAGAAAAVYPTAGALGRGVALALAVAMFAAVAVTVSRLERRAGRGGGARPVRSLATTTLAGGALVAAAGYVALFWTLEALPFQDLPNHLTRAVIEVDLLVHGGARFGDLFAFEPQFSPYLGGDALLAGLVAAFGHGAAGKLWVIIVAASLPLSLAIYLRVTGYTSSTIFLACSLSLYLATDWFFVMGMHHYRLAVAFVLLALAAWEVWLRDGRAGALLGWTLLVAAGYLIHLSALVFVAVGAGVAALVALGMRQTSWRRSLTGSVPILALMAWQAGSSRGLPDGTQVWGGLKKLTRVVAPFYRYDWLVDGALLLGFGLVLALLLVRGRATRGDRRFVTAASLMVVFLVAYAAIPYSQGGVAAVDARTLPFGAVFALVAALAAAERGGGRTTLAAALALALALANLAAISAHLVRQNTVLREYRVVAAQVPRGARVLPVSSGARHGHTYPFHHAGAFATLDAGAYTPYLFSAGVTPYFRYRAPVNAPVGESWYHEGETLSERQTAAIASDFEYVLLLDPFDLARLAVSAEPVARNDAARLLRIVPTSGPK
jgi:UDP-N-acetylmuramyl pentapeptide phosphotransferase/UDP-N-acetylglucosamine-1-phosphate transferase